MASRTQLITIFDNFSKTSVKKIDCDYSLVGKYVDCTIISGSWDIFIRDTKSVLEGQFAEPLSARKVTNILATLPKGMDYTKLDGEAWFKTIELEWLKTWLLENHKLLGLRMRGHKPTNSFRSKK